LPPIQEILSKKGSNSKKRSNSVTDYETVNGNWRSQTHIYNRAGTKPDYKQIKSVTSSLDENQRRWPHLKRVEEPQERDGAGEGSKGRREREMMSDKRKRGARLS
jgi:hypothetical protein